MLIIMVGIVILILFIHAWSCFCYTSFLFGDSLVDAGNNDYLITLSKADSPPYGIDFIPSRGQPTGRFTNGRTVSDIIVQALGSKSFPPPFLAPTTRGQAIFKGVNYASGSSGILDKTGSVFVERVPLRKQINDFEQSRATMTSMLGENGTTDFLKQVVFSITSGSNDLLNYLQPSIPFFKEDKVSPAMLQDFMVSNLTLQLKVLATLIFFLSIHLLRMVMANYVRYPCYFAKRLYEMGGRKFLVIDVGPLGCIPFVRAIKLMPAGRCSSEANELIQGYNRKLKKSIDTLNKNLGPETIFVYANSYDIVMGIVKRYRKYGFENVEDPCCGGNFPPFTCLKRGGANISSVLCKDRSKYVFWDAYHPTEAANLIIAKKFLYGDESIVSPVNVRELYNYNL
ncbi:GDSL esterase/lipase At5g41890-like isoform X1 [Papaver somniferum]|uniref:GDSL esterase/lipase At5g41890-like isoform X1 n=1 Tax=Papaver somniferum TaxID=3469 RepID=UPI000E6FE454|nr:GDSL esterase/lipase At5g41890-like isoform X1 [Papaver somniferum]